MLRAAYRNSWCVLSALALLLCSGSSAQTDPGDTSALLRTLVAGKWGPDGVLLPTPYVWVHYEADLGERWVVDFESGEIVLECLWLPDTDPGDETVRSAMACAVSNLYVTTPLPPEEMLKRQQRAGHVPARVPYEDLRRRDHTWRYTVRKGDTLSGIGKRFRVPVASILAVNALRNPDAIDVGLELVIPEPRPHLDSQERPSRADGSLLQEQLADPETGKRVDAGSVGAFGRRAVQRQGIESEIIRGADGQQRRVTRTRIRMADDHLRVRALRYYPLVKKCAERFGHDPAVIMAIVHTESAFNPQAHSSARAYGLMQLVPASGGREAYRWLYRRDVPPTPEYLLQPGKNVELGTAYLRVLQDRMFGQVRHPTSRLYCSIAAYNAGAGNVARAFTGLKSVQASLDEINSANPEQVLLKLRTDAPSRETRVYVKRVVERVPLYRPPVWTPDEAG